MHTIFIAKYYIFSKITALLERPKGEMSIFSKRLHRFWLNLNILRRQWTQIIFYGRNILNLTGFDERVFRRVSVTKYFFSLSKMVLSIFIKFLQSLTFLSANKSTLVLSCKKILLFFMSKKHISSVWLPSVNHMGVQYLCTSFSKEVIEVLWDYA
jgi:hypothetical protein